MSKSYYSVVLFGNRKGATINKDYVATTCGRYKRARAMIKSNGGWGNIKEYDSHFSALKEVNDFIIEIRGQGLSVSTKASSHN